ncbi:hypothetical protein V8E51_014796 [Hyaloscypha variabilis]
MTTYKIIFVNNRGSDGNYAIFGGPPQFSTASSSTPVYSNVWISEFVPSGGNITIQTTGQFYAWAGKVPFTPVPGTIIEGGVAEVAQLGTPTDPGSTYAMVIKQATPTLQGPTMTSLPSAFEIDCGHDFPNPNTTYLIGIGMLDGNGVVTPVASTLAQNGMNTQIFPIMKFYIGQYDLEAGTVVDFQSVSSDAAVIDFSGGPGYGQYTAIVRQDLNANWNVTYGSSTVTAAALQAIADGTLGSYLGLNNPSDPTINADKLAQLESQIIALSALLQSIGVAEPQVTQTWRGFLKWPAAITIVRITAGATIVAAYLIGKGYTVNFATTTTASGQQTNFTLTPPSSFDGTLASGVDPVADWNAAVAADTNNDGHTNGGISAVSTLLTLPFKDLKTGAPNTLTENTRQQILNGN